MEAVAETSTGIQETHGILPHTSTTNTQIIRSGSSTLKVTSTPTMDDNQLFHGSSTTSTPDPSMPNFPRSVLPARPPSPTSVTSTSTSTLYPPSTMHPANHGENEAAISCKFTLLFCDFYEYEKKHYLFHIQIFLFFKPCDLTVLPHPIRIYLTELNLFDIKVFTIRLQSVLPRYYCFVPFTLVRYSQIQNIDTVSNLLNSTVLSICSQIP